MHLLDSELVRPADDNSLAEEPVVEIPVLLESQLLTELEAAARQRGTSAGRIVRRLIRDFLSCSPAQRSAEPGA
jgi:metal-responsive CopG/Arc/MetJ family transcriptional regulator